MNDFAAVCFCVFLTMLSTALIVAENVMMDPEEASSGYSQTYNNR
jgi:hypothetical protein